jgi:hypothetical protein
MGQRPIFPISDRWTTPIGFSTPTNPRVGYTFMAVNGHAAMAMVQAQNVKKNLWWK